MVYECLQGAGPCSILESQQCGAGGDREGAAPGAEAGPGDSRPGSVGPPRGLLGGAGRGNRYGAPQLAWAQFPPCSPPLSPQRSWSSASSPSTCSPSCAGESWPVSAGGRGRGGGRHCRVALGRGNPPAPPCAQQHCSDQCPVPLGLSPLLVPQPTRVSPTRSHSAPSPL
ncbi:6-phosphogluconate dehydrogenase [Platysternon megacephalum]|uniref:6-phosphogluconate dehydrogenase n=1 Tax=Platysternon megacephalum TaxID=55544 RepID=A0A4D9DDA1_9SAUR|nr:6-phosphogluconate dehydrogenase [Platysternon megacephalum]